LPVNLGELCHRQRLPFCREQKPAAACPKIANFASHEIDNDKHKESSRTEDGDGFRQGGPMRLPLSLVLACGLLNTGWAVAQQMELPQPVPMQSGPSLAAPKCVADPPNFFWVRDESLTWWIQSAPLPPLVTTSPQGTPVIQAGVLGQDTTSTVFGVDRANNESRCGVRYTLGMDLLPDTLGVEGYFLILNSQSHGFGLSSTGNPILARPFFNVQRNRPDAELIAFPGGLHGTVQAEASSSNLLGAGALARCTLLDHPHLRLDLLGGYRFLRFDEGLDVQEDLTLSIPGQTGTTAIGVQDSFVTHNEFHGGELGAETELRGGPFTLNLLAKCAVGNNHRETKINGFTTTTLPGELPVTLPGGLLAQPTNSGNHTDNAVSVIPELGLRLGWRLSPNIQLSAGYTVMWWTAVLRPGDQVDLRVNTSRQSVNQGGPALPAYPNNDSSLWIQGLNLGLAFRF
jgi:hypothetical protein